MAQSICSCCRASLRGALRARQISAPHSSFSSQRLRRDFHSTPRVDEELGEAQDPIGTNITKEIKTPFDIQTLLSRPTWSVKSLLPPSTIDPKANAFLDATAEEITPQKLRHLLRLSALPLPTSPDEEATMISTLSSQLHFLRHVQSVDTTEIEPLRAIRDETSQGIKESAVGLDTNEIREALKMEEIKGSNRRPRRMRMPRGTAGAKEKGVLGKMAREERWDVFETADSTEELAGNRYFVVRSGKQ